MTHAALFLSPHLDDVAFSCGGTLIRLIAEGFRVRLCTIFTASVPDPHGFALACQLDKGLAADVDYMALRRAEDDEFARLAGVLDSIHLAHREAPHRGYSDAPDLFRGVHESDVLWRELVPQFQDLAKDCGTIFAPQGLGNHVDHLQVIRAVTEAGLAESTVWYQDTPYAIRCRAAVPSPLLPGGLRERRLAIDIQRKIECCQLYRTQVPFQFGGYQDMGVKLTSFHRKQNGYAEVFLAQAGNDLPLLV